MPYIMAERWPAIFGRDFARGLWKLTRLYWTAPEARRGKLLLAVAVALELGSVYGAFVIADAQRRIFDALGDRDTAAFLSGIALGGLMIGHLAQYLVNGDAGQQLAQVVRVLDVKLAGAGSPKKRPKHRLHDVFRIDPAGQALADAPSGQGQHPFGIAVEQDLGRLLIAGAPGLQKNMILLG